jgi:hypothetical protein
MMDNQKAKKMLERRKPPLETGRPMMDNQKNAGEEEALP